MDCVKPHGNTNVDAPIIAAGITPPLFCMAKTCRLRTFGILSCAFLVNEKYHDNKK
jgi:hypothetical protein